MTGSWVVVVVVVIVGTDYNVLLSHNKVKLRNMQNQMVHCVLYRTGTTGGKVKCFMKELLCMTKIMKLLTSCSDTIDMIVWLLSSHEQCLRFLKVYTWVAQPCVTTSVIRFCIYNCASLLCAQLSLFYFVFFVLILVDSRLALSFCLLLGFCV